MPVTHDQAQQLASLARAIRPHGARRWDEAGIVAAIGLVKHLDLAEVAMATIVGAADRSLDTPAAIGNTRSPLWQSGRWRNPEPQTRREPFDRGTFCGTCQQPEHRCRQLWANDHDFVSVHDHTAQAARDRAERPPLRALLPTPDADTTRTETEETTDA